jgi:hypothetical protein
MKIASLYKNYSNKWITIILAGILVTTGISCNKGDSGGGGTPPPPAEAQITFTINPDPGTTVMAALAATQDIAITITSKLPTAGAKVDLTLTKDADGSTVFSQSLTSSSSSITATFQNLVSGVICTATIKVTSASTASNNASKTFKIAKK